MADITDATAPYMFQSPCGAADSAAARAALARAKGGGVSFNPLYGAADSAAAVPELSEETAALPGLSPIPCGWGGGATGPGQKEAKNPENMPSYQIADDQRRCAVPTRTNGGSGA